MKFRTQYNREKQTRDYEVTIGPSMTIPDQSMSIAEIMQRHTRGLPIDGARVPLYAGGDELTSDDYLPDLKNLDLAEQQELREQAADEIADIKMRHEKTMARKAKASEPAAPSSPIKPKILDQEEIPFEEKPKKKP